MDHVAFGHHPLWHCWEFLGEVKDGADGALWVLGAGVLPCDKEIPQLYQRAKSLGHAPVWCDCNQTIWCPKGVEVLSPDTDDL